MLHYVMDRRRFVLAVCVVGSLSLLSGCGKAGPKAWPVGGRVTFQGKPVADASIRFSNPQAGTDLMAKLDADGKYAVVAATGSGLPEGTYQVAVMPSIKSAPVGTFGPIPTQNRPDIPQRYRLPATSGLTATVTSGSLDFNVDMRSNP